MVNGLAGRIWDRDGSLWSDDPAVQATARDRLGWLDTPRQMLAQVSELRRFADELRQDGFTHAAVLGMGGSSLAPEVLRETFGIAPGYLALEVLDTTDPDAIRAMEGRLDLPRTLFIVASKSGTTTEPLAFMEYFWSKAPAGRQFVAITDPGTPLERTAAERGFRRVFPHPPDVGGRYAALTAIGMVPAACMGVDLERLLTSAAAMADRCRATSPDQNPGLALGAEIGRWARDGQDKLTLICSPGVGTFGYWVEQLVAESTGKQGTGILPVEGEPLGMPGVYGDDRAFIYLRLTGEPDGEQDRLVDAIEQAGHPVGRLDLPDRYDLGGEFFRWEFAVPVASTFIGVEPFDQPNVQESKDNTNRLLKLYSDTGGLPGDTALLTDAGLALYGRGAAAGAVRGARSLADALTAYLKLVKPGDYVAVTAYIPPTGETEQALDVMRTAVRDQLHVATTTGYGPRFLHSTGQLHKGGSDDGVFLQLTCDPVRDLQVPGKPYTFGILMAAQALGDLQSLQSRDRRALRVHLGADVPGGLRALREALTRALG
jgi:glucose-6-phosphate isomerase